MNRIWFRRPLFWILAVPLAAVLALIASSLPDLPAMGAKAEGSHLARVKASPRFKNGRFVDVLPRSQMKLWESTKAWFFDGTEHRAPTAPIPFVVRTRGDFDAEPGTGLRITWLGHSTLLVEIDGKKVLIDPVWGERASPFWWTGVERFFPPPLPFGELPRVDAVVISHDHYDHLDYPTIQKLATLEVPFLVPLGVAAHLAYWGVPEERIFSFDWWEEKVIGGLRLVSTPARHFSGRGLLDRETTLWCGWAIIGPSHRVYYSGDTAMFPGFSEIGERLGPFDATMIESGAYNQLWADVHLGPEQAVRAHEMVRGKLMIPVHWGLFDLALHSWTEPMERVLASAEQKNIQVGTLRPGESVEPANYTKSERWWPNLPWQTASEAPIVSSHLTD